MVEIRVEIVPFPPRRPLLRRGVRAHLLDEHPVAQPLRALPAPPSVSASFTR